MAGKTGGQPAVVTQAAAKAAPETSSGNLIMDVMDSAGGDEPASRVSDDNPKAWESTEDSPDELDDLFNTETDDQTKEDQSGEDEDTEESASQQDPAKIASDEEVITITDGTGKKQIRINYSDRAATKRAYELAHGSRKWQSERDRALAENKKLTETTQGDRKMVGALEKAWEEGGEAAVLDLIAGRQGAHNAWLDKELAKRELYKKGKPEEIAAYEKQERLEKIERDLARRDARDAEREKAMKADKEAADIARLEGTMHPIYEKYRFDGKLGNTEDEEFFDDILWNEAVKRLKPYEDQKVEITREMVNREFNAVAQQLRRRMNGQAEKKAKQAIEQVKETATQSAQASTMSAYKGNGAAKEANDLISSGNLKGLFNNWDKYSKVFRK